MWSRRLHILQNRQWCRQRLSSGRSRTKQRATVSRVNHCQKASPPPAGPSSSNSQSSINRFLKSSGELRHLSIPECSTLTGFSRSTIYRALLRGDLVAVKNGKACRIPITNLRDYMANLPRATFGKEARRVGYR